MFARISHDGRMSEDHEQPAPASEAPITLSDKPSNEPSNSEALGLLVKLFERFQNGNSLKFMRRELIQSLVWRLRHCSLLLKGGAR
jgi:hypothetical protein